MNLKARLSDTWGSPNPERRQPGRGSVVTIIEIGRDDRPLASGWVESGLMVTCYDEWGHIFRCRASDVVVEPEP